MFVFHRARHGPFQFDALQFIFLLVCGIFFLLVRLAYIVTFSKTFSPLKSYLFFVFHIKVNDKLQRLVDKFRFFAITGKMCIRRTLFESVWHFRGQKKQ